ncbi:HNH endonuclease [Mesorhizobium australicum]|uniref:HNH endonuclease n=1 Tax=Mesorhizobium australicum TaxID=536018 RepID=A0ACC6T7G2_9HYPH
MADEFPRLDVTIPEWKEPSHPFSRGQDPEFYTPETLRDTALGRTGRTSFFEQIFAGLYWKLEGPVPYAFITSDGAVRSMDAGCIKFLASRESGEIEFQLGPNRVILAASPGPVLLERYTRIREKLIRDVTRSGGATDTQQELVQVPFPAVSTSAASVDSSLSDDTEFLLDELVDERKRQESLLVIREGANDFRRAVLREWKRCAVTGSTTKEVLDAAHVYRYFGLKTNDIRNGIMLRRDIHSLFDKYLMSFAESGDTLRIVLSQKLKGSEYEKYDGVLVELPQDQKTRPDIRTVRHHLTQFELAEARRKASR